MKEIGVILSFFVFLAVPFPSMAQQINLEGWPVPDLQGLVPYSMSITHADGVEKIVEKFELQNGGQVARVSGNGKVFAYAVDRDREPPIDWLILDPTGTGTFTMKLGPKDPYVIPDWVFK